LVDEYLAVLFESEDANSELRHRETIEHHAELNYRLNGGGKCAICRSHVRHVVQVTIRKGRKVENYHCLCTRCLEGERSTADAVSLSLGRAVVTYQPRKTDAAPRRWDDPRHAPAVPIKSLAATKR
jgi:hypothetical protein